MIAKLITGVALTAATTALTLAATGTATAATYGSPGNAVVASATCTHKDDATIEISMDSPKIYAQAGYQPGEHQQVRYRTVVYDAVQNSIAGVTEYSSGKATATSPAKVDDTKLKVTRNDPNGYRVIQQIEWLSADQENPVAAVDLDATGYQIKDGRTLLGTFTVCK